MVLTGSSVRSQQALICRRLQSSVCQSRMLCVQPSSGTLACRRRLYCRSLAEVRSWEPAAASVALGVEVCRLQLLACLHHCQVDQLGQAQAQAVAAKLGAAAYDEQNGAAWVPIFTPLFKAECCRHAWVRYGSGGRGMLQMWSIFDVLQPPQKRCPVLHFHGKPS